MWHTNDCRFGYLGMRDQAAFNLGGADAVTRNINHIVDAAHKPIIAIRVSAGTVAGVIIAGEFTEISGLETFRVSPEGAHHAEPRLLDAEPAAFVDAGLFAIFLQYNWLDAGEGEEWPNKHDLSTLRLLGSVGEPINPEAWMWYHRVIGKEKCPIVDTWWQTETGGILITPLPGAIPTKPGSATLPFPGVEPIILRENGSEAGINEGGWLCIKKPWPGMMRTIFGDPARFKETYFSKFPGYYNTGDGARKDQDGYYWLMGRIDDVINVSGHRIGTAEVESSLVSHTKVAEAAVVGMPHSLKGQGIYAYVTLKTGEKASPDLEKELKGWVRQQIGPIATPDVIQFADGLPKTRSGKIMRRILVKIAAGNTDSLGDTSTLADPSVVDTLMAGRKK